MGLNIYCNCEQINFRAGSYSGFNLWRTVLAQLYDIDLENMYGFNGEKRWTTEEPFYELLYHSDCDDELSPSNCKLLLQDFKEPINKEKLSKILKDKSEISYWLQKFQLWYEAIQHSVENDCTILFG